MRFARVLVFLALAAAPSAICRADNFSFTGNFANDNDVQAFTFTVGATSTVTLQTLSYAGGTNAAGQTIARGGFDPILALFSGTGSSAVLINQNDDGGSSVPPDTLTGERYDTYLQSTLAPGTYTTTIMQYDNFSNGGTLGNGFSEGGNTNFTAGFGCSDRIFCDVSGVTPYNNRDSHWAFDIDGVNGASQVGGGGGSVTPEPGTFVLLGTGVLGLAGSLRRRLFN